MSNHFSNIIIEEIIKSIDTPENIQEKLEKKVFDVIRSTPQEKKNTASDPKLNSNIKKELARYLNSNLQKVLKQIMHEYDFPRELRSQMGDLFNKNLKEIPEFLSKDFARQVTAIYSIFRKYVETKKKITQTKQEYQIKEVPLNRIKMMVGAGRSLGEIADALNIPKTTLAYKLKHLYQTSFTILKKQMGR